MVEHNNEQRHEAQAAKPADAPEAPRESSPPDLRADRLLADSKSVLGGSNSDKPNPINGDKIEFSNPYPPNADGKGNSSPDFRDKGGTFPKEKLAPLGALDTNFGINKNDFTTNHFAVSGDLSKLDPKKPTVAFLDSKDQFMPLDGQKLSHADTSALAAQRSGFNAIVLDTSKDKVGSAIDTFVKEYKTNPDQAIAKTAAQLGDDKLGLDKLDKKDLLGAAKILGKARNETPYAPAMNEFADKIESGHIPMGKGDVLNVSMGDNAEKDKKGNFKPGTGDPTFAELSKKMGFELNPNNLAESKDKIMERLGEIAKDPSDKDWQTRAQNALDTNKAIERLQGLGLEVVHSASNDGNDRVDINFLKANHELQSVDPQSGKLDKFSGIGNVSTDGVVPIYRQQDSDGATKYSMGGTKFDQTDLERLNGTFKFSPKGYKQQSDISIADTKVESNQEKLQSLVDKLAARPAPAVKSEKGELAAIAIGNSFDNIQYLQSQHDRLLAKKQDQASSYRF